MTAKKDRLNEDDAMNASGDEAIRLLGIVARRVYSLHHDNAKYSHECPEWDFMTIDEFDAEFNVCLCYPILGTKKVTDIAEGDSNCQR